MRKKLEGFHKFELVRTSEILLKNCSMDHLKIQAKNYHVTGRKWYTPIILVFIMIKQKNHKFENSMDYIMTFRAAEIQ